MTNTNYDNDPLFLNPKLVELYEPQASWDRELRINGQATNRRQPEREFFVPLVMAADSILDVGCGTGELLRLARERGHQGRLVGVEPAGPMLEVAKQRSDVEWVHGDATAGRWRDEFDLVVMTGHVFQVILDEERLRVTLTAVRDALKAGGCFVFDARNPLVRDWENWMPDVVWEFESPDGAHIRKWHEVESLDGDVVWYSTTYASESWDAPETFRSGQRFYTREDVAALLDEADLEMVEQLGHWDRRPFTDESPEIITIARRAGS